MDKRFRLTLTLDVKTEEVDGTQKDFFASSVVYAGLPRDGVLGIEKALLGLLAQLNDFGVVQARAAGVGLPLTDALIGGKL